MGEFDVVLKRIRSSRSLKLRVFSDGKIVVTAPLHVRDLEIENFVAANKAWILEKRQKIMENAENLTQNREKLFFRGKEYDFRLNIVVNTYQSTSLQPSLSHISYKNNSAVVDEGKIIVTSPSENHQIVRSILEKWYRQQAETYFKQRVPLLSDLVGKDLMRVTIRSQRSRWGSCSSHNTISLNWRLIMAPDFVSDYVIYHELAHLTHMNHSAKFWQLVADYIPNFKEAEKWLKKHHALLQF